MTTTTVYHCSGHTLKPSFLPPIFTDATLSNTHVRVGMVLDGEIAEVGWWLSPDQLPFMADLLECAAAEVRKLCPEPVEAEMG